MFFFLNSGICIFKKYVINSHVQAPILSHILKFTTSLLNIFVYFILSSDDDEDFLFTHDAILFVHDDGI